MEITSNGKTITLNEKQCEFIEVYKEWRKNKESLFLCLMGSAGSGKTTCCKEAIKDEFSLVVTAPTHKAKKVISKLTGRSGETIQKILGLRPGVELQEFNHKNLLFSLSGSPLMQDYHVVVIDESSMLSAGALKYIKELATQLGTKILFMGDPNQLPPIGEEISEVFTDPIIQKFKLEKVERQSVGNPIGELLDSILSNINSMQDNYKKISNFNEETREGYKFISSPEEFKKELCDKFKFGEYSDNRILTWTNAKSKSWNRLIRNEMFKKESQEIYEQSIKRPLVVGEYLVAHRTVNDLVNWRINILENSCEYKVTEISEGTREQAYWNSDANKFDKVVFFGYEVEILNLDTQNYKKIFIIDHQSYPEFARIDIDKSNYAMSKPEGKERGYAWKQYYDFRDKYCLLGDILGEGGKVECAKDIDYAYACTVYKSQGSTYDNVFIDEPNLDEYYSKGVTKQQIATFKNKQKYVAISRLSKAAFIYFKEAIS